MVKPFATLVPKRSWSQFSLRALLGTTAFICILLGGWHLLHTYGNRIEVNDVSVGEPIKVKVRYCRVFGPPVCRIQVSVSDWDYDSPHLHYGGSSEDNKKRSWLCFYTHECEFEPVRRPCELSVELSELIPAPPGSAWSWKIRTVKRRTVDVQ
jgi:hypothetical protein